MCIRRNRTADKRTIPAEETGWREGVRYPSKLSKGREKKMKVERIKIIKPINEPIDYGVLVAVGDFLGMAKIDSYQELTGSLREMGWRLVVAGTDGKMATRFRKSETTSTWTNDSGSILKIWKVSNGLILTFGEIEIFCQFDKNMNIGYKKLVKEETEMQEEDKKEDGSRKFIVHQYGPQNRVYSDSNDKSINVIGDLTGNFENLRALIDIDYKNDDKNELLQIVDQMKQSCKDPSKKNWLVGKLGWLAIKNK